MVKTDSKNMSTANLAVDTISCQGCVGSIERGLSRLEGIQAVQANLTNSVVHVKYNPEIISISEIRQKLDDLNYIVRARSVDIEITGMHCASCSARVEQELIKSAGILKAHVNLADQSAKIEYYEPDTSTDQIIKTIEKIGYTASYAEDESEGSKLKDDYTRRLMINLRIALPLTVLIFVISHLDMLGISVFGKQTMFYVLFALTIPVQFYCGRQFYAGFWKSLKNFSASMDTLVVVGTSAAFIYSVIATFIPSLLTGSNQTVAVYFDTAAVIITLILLGRLLENRAKNSTAYEVEKLVRMESKSALIESEGVEVEIDRADVKVGDIVIIKPGSKLPVDGAVTYGHSAVDESMLTGEPVARELQTGDRVLAGSLNKTGSFKYEALAVGSDTVLSKIIESVREIISSKAPIQRLADKVASIFVPTVMIIAMAAFAAWMIIPSTMSLTFALMIFISVLIIACPCALGLATPTAIMVGSARGAREGILIKSAEILEKVGRIDTVIFDKTGTLTIGRPQVEKIINPGKRDDNDIIRFAASLEKDSEHPLAEAVLAFARENKVIINSPSDFESIPGRGLKGTVENSTVFLGNHSFMEDENISIPEDAERLIRDNSNGKTLLFLSVDHKLEGMIVVSDEVKPGAKSVIAELKRTGRTVSMLTGDNKESAGRIAAEVGIDVVKAELLPHEKLQYIKSLKADGRNAAMVGDGVNDSPALAEADIGIALGSGADVAMSFSDITLIGSSLSGVNKALVLSELTLKTIRQNLWWAFGYNIIAIPIAAGILYPVTGLLLSPMIASAAMAFSSILVVTNSLRLKKVRL